MAGRIAKRVFRGWMIIILVTILEGIGIGPSVPIGWVIDGVFKVITPYSKELGLVPDYMAFEPISTDWLTDKSPEIVRGLEAYNRKDFEDAYRIWLPLAEAGNAEAQFRVGFLFNLGEGVDQDFAESKYWYELSSVQNHRGAIVGLGNIHINGIFGDKNRKYGAELLEKATFMGSATAPFLLGLAYDLGKGFPIDKNESHRLYNLSFNRGKCRAANEIAYDLSMPEIGITLDLQQALLFAEKASEMGCKNRLLLFYIQKKM